MLNRSQTLFLRLASCSQHNPNNPFFGMPKEIIHRITYSPIPDSDFLAALKEAAYAQLEPLRIRLEKAKSNTTALQHLLLQAGEVTTPAGLLVKNTTLLEFAICAGDVEMATMIKTYFSAFRGGEDEMLTQLEHCQPALIEMQSQTHEDLTEIMNIILTSTPQEVLEELKKPENYNWDYQSPLRDTLNQFRKSKLDPKNRCFTRPKMHCNYQNLIHAYELLDLYWESLKINGSDNKHNLFSRQVISFIQLTELPALERQWLAQDELAAAATDKITSRSFNYAPGHGSFPDYDKDFNNTRLNVGFNTYISIFGRVSLDIVPSNLMGLDSLLKNDSSVIAIRYTRFLLATLQSNTNSKLMALCNSSHQKFLLKGKAC